MKVVLFQAFARSPCRHSCHLQKFVPWRPAAIRWPHLHRCTLIHQVYRSQQSTFFALAKIDLICLHFLSLILISIAIRTQDQNHMIQPCIKISRVTEKFTLEGCLICALHGQCATILARKTIFLLPIVEEKACKQGIKIGVCCQWEMQNLALKTVIPDQHSPHPKIFL